MLARSGTFQLDISNLVTIFGHRESDTGWLRIVFTRKFFSKCMLKYISSLKFTHQNLEPSAV
jgi:hypothetical protein